MKMWNQDRTVKYSPMCVTKWVIREPGNKEVRNGEIIVLTQYKVNAQGDDGYFTIGYYDTKEEAVNEVDRLDNLGKEDIDG